MSGNERQCRFEVDNRDWRSRSGQSSAFGDTRSRETIHGSMEKEIHSRQAQLNFQTESTIISGNLGVGASPGLAKAEVPWSSRRGIIISEKERVLKTVRGILNKLTPTKFDVLESQLMHSGITSVEILKGVVSLIHDKAVREPMFCPMYALLCSNLWYQLPEFPTDEPHGGRITFKQILLNNCQEAFEGAFQLRAEVRQMAAPEQEMERREKERLVKPRALGNIRLTGELFKQRMITEIIMRRIVQVLLGHDDKVCPAEENVEAICQLFNTIGKQLDESSRFRVIHDKNFDRLKELTSNPQLPPRLRFMVQDVLDLRSNHWVPRREEVKPKTIFEIHYEAEKNMEGPPSFMVSPTTGGIMPGMPGTRKLHRGLHTDNWKVPLFRSMPSGAGSSGSTVAVHSPSMGKYPSFDSKLLPQSLGSGDMLALRTSPLLQSNGPSPRKSNVTMLTPSTSRNQSNAASATEMCPVNLRREKTVSLLAEYFSVITLDEALMCVEELQAPAYHPEVVKEALFLALVKIPPRVGQVSELLELLYSRHVLTAKVIEMGCIHFGSLLDDLSIDLPKVPSSFGEVIGKLVLSGSLDFRAVKEVLHKVDNSRLRAAILDAVLQSLVPGQGLLEAQNEEVQACRDLLVS
ncbi:eukaryotic translation initiation factor-like [Punica granatum]|uniref:Eukaryotic translation initiation factor-like n=2 Tax=Punica granatum TaxID=22663 RepID=A0A6P8BXE0_PUNGR|nr:eukaryotic translation initiation factor-like [Punica granatum]XP_031373919.1 eukaryotic translation initiation factor-like [Punica granatum]XP_031373920.1 eukaryotic translation initiation factor-like [Punica granatum]XP_031373921.1 eukaryotic translation initiation factor-like [Punica granatum]